MQLKKQSAQWLLAPLAMAEPVRRSLKLLCVFVMKCADRRQSPARLWDPDDTESHMDG